MTINITIFFDNDKYNNIKYIKNITIFIDLQPYYSIVY